jgi:phosphoserine phosphatase
MPTPDQLPSPGWAPDIRRQLLQLIEEGKGKGLPVVFDFDNTIICGDIGEATLSILVRDGLLTSGRIAEPLKVPFRDKDGQEVVLESDLDIISYYEALLEPTAHGDRDLTPMANAYAWIVEIMAGLSPADITQATAEAFGGSRPMALEPIKISKGLAPFPAPFLYPESLELIAELKRNGFDVWIFSASNVWSVRWMIAHVINPALGSAGVERGIRADHVVGISTLLQDTAGKLYKDTVLVREEADYATLQQAALGSFWLSSQFQFPVPTYSGKVACIWDALQTRPYLAVGDSPGDLPMLKFSHNRLWIARMEKPRYQERLVGPVRSKEGRWLIQPVLSKSTPGFLPNLDGPVGPELRVEVEASRRILGAWF